jgi:hypothetical protein
MSLLRSWRSIFEPNGYKYSVPNGTGLSVKDLGQKTKSLDLVTQAGTPLRIKDSLVYLCGFSVFVELFPRDFRSCAAAEYN